MKTYTQAEIEALITVEEDQRVIRAVDFSMQSLRGLNLSSIIFINVIFKQSDLSRVDLCEASLEGTNLRGSNLRDAWLGATNLRDAWLTGVDLIGVDLRWATGNGKEIKSVRIGDYQVVWTPDQLAIGCQQHSIEEWKSFTEERIREISNEDLNYYHKYKNDILQLIEG